MSGSHGFVNLADLLIDPYHPVHKLEGKGILPVVQIKKDVQGILQYLPAFLIAVLAIEQIAFLCQQAAQQFVAVHRYFILFLINLAQEIFWKGGAVWRINMKMA